MLPNERTFAENHYSHNNNYTELFTCHKSMPYLIHHLFTIGQVETEETENRNGKLKRKTEAEIGNGIAEIGKWSSTIVALMAYFAHARSVWG